jgi:glc operon protein GlcG
MKSRFPKASIAFGAFLLLGGFATQASAITTQSVLQDSDVEKIVAAAKKSMDENHTKGCIAIADADGQLLFLQRQEGSAPNCTSSAIGKVTTAAKFQMDTGTYYKQLGQNNAVMLAVPELTPLPGGKPLYHGKEVIGAVAVSTPDGDLDLKVVADAAAVIK